MKKLEVQLSSGYLESFWEKGIREHIEWYRDSLFTVSRGRRGNTSEVNLCPSTMTIFVSYLLI